MTSELRRAIENAYSYKIEGIPREFRGKVKFETTVDVNAILDAVIASLPKIQTTNMNQTSDLFSLSVGYNSALSDTKSLLEQAKEDV